MKKLLTPAEAALVLGIDEETVRVYARSGRLQPDAEHRERWGALAFTAAELKRYAKAKKKPGRQPTPTAAATKAAAD